MGFGHLTTKITIIISINLQNNQKITLLQLIRSVFRKFTEIPGNSENFMEISQKLSKINTLPDTPPSTDPYPPTSPHVSPPQVQVNFPRDGNLDTISGVFPTPQLKLI